MTDPRIESKIRALEQEVAELKRRLDVRDAVDAQVASENGPWAPPLAPDACEWCGGACPQGWAICSTCQGRVSVCASVEDGD